MNMTYGTSVETGRQVTLKRKNLKNPLAVIMTICFIALLSACANTGYDYGNDVSKWISQYNCEFDILAPETASEGEVRYTCVTRDDRKISFTVLCRMVNKEVPFAFTLPVKEHVVSDDFAERLCDWFSESLEPIKTDSVTTADLAITIRGKLDEFVALIDEYGIKGKSPAVKFRLIRGDSERIFECADINTDLIKHFLADELFE